MRVDDTLYKNLLQTNESGIKLSIYQPTHPASTGETVQEDVIRFKNALQAIQSSPEYNESDLSATMKKLKDLENDTEFWKHRTLGLAVFANKQGYQTVDLNYDLTEDYYVDEQYQVGPLVLMQSLGSSYFALDINHSNPRFFAGTPAGCNQVEIEGMPESFESLTENVEYTNELQHQSGGVGTFHGHSDKDALQENAQWLYREIAKAVDEYLKNHDEPLVLVGVEERVAAVRQVLDYSNVLDDYVEGSGEAMNLHELHTHVMPIIEKYNANRRNDLVNTLNETPPARVAIGQHEINAATHEGRVATLFIPCFRSTADTVREGSSESIVLQLGEKDEENEELVRGVVAQGGEVVATAMTMFDDKQARAICRF